MNEQIGKLISEAIKAIPDHVDFDLPKEFTEKFAELIVRECARSIEKTIETNCDTDSEKMGCEFAITDLLKHFGVER
jgi:hypothetical protein